MSRTSSSVWMLWIKAGSGTRFSTSISTVTEPPLTPPSFNGPIQALPTPSSSSIWDFNLQRSFSLWTPLTLMVIVQVPVENPISCRDATIFYRAEANSASFNSSAVPESITSPSLPNQIIRSAKSMCPTKKNWNLAQVFVEEISRGFRGREPTCMNG